MQKSSASREREREREKDNSASAFGLLGKMAMNLARDLDVGFTDLPVSLPFSRLSKQGAQ